MQSKIFHSAVLLALFAAPNLFANFDIDAIAPLTDKTFAQLYQEAEQSGVLFVIVRVDTLVNPTCRDKTSNFFWRQTLIKHGQFTDPINGKLVRGCQYFKVLKKIDEPLYALMSCPPPTLPRHELLSSVMDLGACDSAWRLRFLSGSEW